MLARADRYLMTASNDDDNLLRIERPQAGWAGICGLVSAVTVVVALFAGLMMMATQALSEPDALALARERPLATLQIVLGLLMVAALVLIPVRRLVGRVSRAGLVEIDGGFVRVRERNFLSTRSFAEPLTSYLGAAHRIRTTLSGIEHQLVLVHPDPQRDVVVVVDGSQPAVAVARMTTRLGLPEIPVRDIARARGAGPVPSIAGLAGATG